MESGGMESGGNELGCVPATLQGRARAAGDGRGEMGRKSRSF